MEPVLNAQNITYTVGGRRILDGLNLTLNQGDICGLVGRNGAGKTTLLAALAGQILPDKGYKLELFSQAPNAASLARTHLMRTSSVYVDWASARQILDLARRAYPGWNKDLEEQLITDFDLNTRTRFMKMSDGQKSAVGIIIALASRADITFLDEPYVGLDPVARSIFYDRLLEDYAEHPRTFLISTHLVDEIAPLLNRVIFLDSGKIVMGAGTEETTYSAHELAGNSDAVSVYLARSGLEGVIVRQRSVGSLQMVLVAADLTPEREELAHELGLHIQPISLQEAVAVYSGSRDITRGGTR